ncbi:hypothetical protein P154DRAFT_319853 [Amniculicola lignicola CBS 123094]|uniref:F-box domain-containing protein n=1 Tax=Amniculicola lignicola CBS 123094 TaxID=1392246 RepID=A0A6A5W3P7_9PLEO|nr:hypothetical protein P154DRAFT_319853 [Amniculicola lignicola CBS 123094]
MPVTNPILNNPATRAVVRRIGRHYNTRAHSNFYTAHLFSKPIETQPGSPLLRIPAEIRLEIYRYVFTPPDMGERALLLTCRLVNHEAIKIAFQNVDWCLDAAAARNLELRIWYLGDLTMELRNVTIDIPFEKLDCMGPNNPFLLMRLPLDKLVINLGRIKQKRWREEISTYYRLLSAFLHHSSVQSPTDERSQRYAALMAKSKLARLKRRGEVGAWIWTPCKDDLYQTMRSCMAKKVVVTTRQSASNDPFWTSFEFFDLVRDIITIVRMPERTTLACLKFFDQGELSVTELTKVTREG